MKTEKEILKYWEKNKIFQKSVEQRSENKIYRFYDGPPFATGLPHYGHIVASLIKDVVPRYWTMRGFRVERRWGWDCHGLPIENIIEKELNLKTKKEIETYGIDNFNNACRAKVMQYAKEWEKTVRRIGRFVDMKNNYKTMDLNYMESVWWVFSELWKKGLIYQGHKPMHICPRCVTPLSNFEASLEYKDIEDLSVIVEFKIKSANFKNTFALAWTTTPWTLPGNMLLAVDKDIQYALFSASEPNNFYLAAKDRIKKIVGNDKLKIIKTLKGSDLVGLEYEPLFPYFAKSENAFRIIASDFVSDDEGTGIVHIAPSFGEDDFYLGQKENLKLIQHVTMEGQFIPEVTDFAHDFVKPIRNSMAIDKKIVEYLKNKDLLWSEKVITHSYPHCWRCESPLINYATDSWFVNVTKIKDDLIRNNKKINWVPRHIKEGRFGQWLEGAKDWAISRNRYWGTPLPIWKCQIGKSQISNLKSQKNLKSKIQNSKQGCGNIKVIGSIEELEKLSGQKINDLHKHIVDKITINCEKCGSAMSRIPEVLDCWFESGSMPYGQMHYPFENKENFLMSFPAKFIAEGQDQTRGWFYTLHILATTLTQGDNPSIPIKETTPAYLNVIVNGIVLAKDGKKMSKKLNNYPDPEMVIDKYSADAMRYYLISSPVMEAEGLNFNEEGVKEAHAKVITLLSNVLSFYLMYGDKNATETQNENILDQWIIARLNQLIKIVNEEMENYYIARASRVILNFISDLSQWYVRRSRERFKTNDKDKKTASATLKYVLYTLSKIIAPFIPFIADAIFLELRNSDDCLSVHLTNFPQEGEVDIGLINRMEKIRALVSDGLAIRAQNNIKVRQPLTKATISGFDISPEEKKLIQDELNVMEVEFSRGKLGIQLDTTLTPKLKEEGLYRDIVRAIQDTRKKAKCKYDEKMAVLLEGIPTQFISKNKDRIETATLTKIVDKVDSVRISTKIGEIKVTIGV